ncbi:MAG: metallophosphoesterase [Pseudomonadota bacterium]|nr:metallophosphoesterase [Pseudomonadota bacterium]
MASTTFSWIHLTDFHYGLDGQDTLWPNLRKPFFDDLAEMHKRTGPWQVVFFTGDLVQQGRAQEFAAMQREVLDRLWRKLHELGSGDAVLLAVPGNHDLVRPDPAPDDPARDKLLEKERFAEVAARFWGKPDGGYRRVVNTAFAAYSDWWGSASQRPRSLQNGILPGDFACTLDCGDHAVGIVGLNTAFFQLASGDYQGKLEWDARQMHAVCGTATDDWVERHAVCMLLTHHGPDWLSEAARRHGDSEILPAGQFALHLYGHAHTASFQQRRSIGEPDAVRLCQSRSVFGMEWCGDPPVVTRQHGYAIGRIAFDDGQASLRLWPRVATDQPRGMGWRYIADGPSGPLDSDGGTRAERVAWRGAPAPGVAGERAAHSLLPSRRPFFGRSRELQDIAACLLPDYTGWGVLLDGPGGFGKTSLALEAAHAAPAALYPLKLFITAKSSRLGADGVHPVDDHRVADYFAMLTEIGHALGLDKIDSVPQELRARQVRHALAAQRVLLVLDNLESFSREERHRVYDLLDFLPSGCRAIVTSRGHDERAAPTLRLDKLDVDAARRLLEKLGERMRAIARLSDAEHHTLYVETGGNPLLLTWVAAQLGRTHGSAYSVAAAVSRLHAAYRKQRSNAHNDPLEFVFGALLDSCSRSETAVLASLCHFSEPAPLACLLPIANMHDSAVRGALDDLRERAVLIEDDAHGRWSLPPLCSRFLRHRRRAAVSAAGGRLQQHACRLATHANRGDGYAELEGAWPLIAAALPLLIEGGNARLQQLCKELYPFLDFSRRWHRLLSLSQAAERKALSAGDLDSAGWRAYDAGRVHALQGDGDAAQACHARCLAHWGAATNARQAAALVRLAQPPLVAQG